MKHKILTSIVLLLSVVFMAACSDDDYNASTDAVVKSITTGDAAVTAISATTHGVVKDLSGMSSDRYVVGTVYGVNPDPTTAGTKQIGAIDELGNVTAELSGLTEGTTYYYATYVTLQGKVTKYGDVKSFVATDADVATLAATDVTSCHATLNAQAAGVDDILSSVSIGFRYATTEEGVEEGVDVPMDEATASVSKIVKGLLPSTTYYYAAYTKLGDGYIFGNVQSFTTKAQTMEYVDMGVSVLWAKCNIGAETESETGILAGFGDQSFYNRSTSNDDYTPWDIAGTEEDMLYNLHIDGDAKMKSTMPTEKQINELVSKTTQSIVEVDGVSGVKFTAKNGNSIFLPLTGYRTGDVTTEAAVGYYWSGTVSTIDEGFAKSLVLNSLGSSVGISARNLGLAIRSVREEEPVEEGITIRNYNGVQGDIQNNGDYRFDIYNQWDGSNTGTDETSVLIPSEVKFNESISVTFSITGTGGNSCEAFMTFADGGWATQNWAYNADGNGSCKINGDGTYTMTLKGHGSGLGVFALDFVGLSKLAGADNLNVKIVKCVMDDWGTKLPFDNAKLVVGDIEENGNVRADIYNQWDGSNTGDQDHCGVDISKVVFSKRIGVTFSVEGTDDKEYQAYLTFADSGWATSNFGYNENGNGSCIIKGDGTYTICLAGSGSGFGVCAIDILKLGEAVGADKVKVRIACIRVE